MWFCWECWWYGSERQVELRCAARPVFDLLCAALLRLLRPVRRSRTLRPGPPAQDALFRFTPTPLRAALVSFSTLSVKQVTNTCAATRSSPR